MSRVTSVRIFSRRFRFHAEQIGRVINQIVLNFYLKSFGYLSVASESDDFSLKYRLTLMNRFEMGCEFSMGCVSGRLELDSSLEL